jgi:hypothetical protein
MWDFNLSQAFGVMFRTWPFIVFRMIVYFGIGLAYVMSVGTGAGLGWVTGYLWSTPDSAPTFTFWGGVVGFGIVSVVLYWLREYLLYLVKAGHIAVMVELMDGRSIPDGRGQIDYAQKVVRERFVESSILFGVDQLVKGVIGLITGTIHTIAAFLPIPGLDNVVRLFNAILRVSLTYVDELILAYMIRTQTKNPYESAKIALVLFAQNYWAFAKNAISLTIVMYLIAFVIFAALVAPALGLAALLPGQWSAWGVAIAAIFAWSFKAALLEPLAIACLMQVFFKKIENQVPDPAWDARLTQMSAKFKTLAERAETYIPRPTPKTQS